MALAAHHRQDVAVDLVGVEGFEHPALRFREAPAERVGHPAELLDDGDLGEHGKGEAAEPARHIDAGETELQGKALMVLRDAVRQPALVQLGMLLIGHKLLLDKGADTPRPVHGGGGQGVGRAAIAGGVVAHARTLAPSAVKCCGKKAARLANTVFTPSSRVIGDCMVIMSSQMPSIIASRPRAMRAAS